MACVVCDTAKVRFFKQITTNLGGEVEKLQLFAILQKYDFSSKSQRHLRNIFQCLVVCDTAKVRFFKQITTPLLLCARLGELFAILQKYDFSSKSQLSKYCISNSSGCLRYCKSTIFQANHNWQAYFFAKRLVVCDTAKVRFFKQITTPFGRPPWSWCCLRYCKSTIFQANHN